ISDKKIGLIKNKNLLEEAISELDNLLTKQVDKLCAAPLKTKILNFNWMRSLELENMLTCLYLSARSSIIREESRGEFYRSDFEYTDNDNWLKTIIIVKENDGIKIRFEKPVVTKIPLPKGGKLTFEKRQVGGMMIWKK
ncbi:MAG: hypothetical protein ACTSPH_14275, partial [Promethearchaeota archaeon]